ncbi:hypothetical protein NHP190003_12880 [Helicobacter sp. NHP19-003]|uniref:Uncharacterized protein n=2 Tax=Helicobacter gastrocanis TaxID=2849641 RepID=A0ABM7SBH2_9HELI|nr:hypothetical protein NHP190003_12880 [Helicobacter sp. NHP19-003]
MGVSELDNKVASKDLPCLITTRDIHDTLKAIDMGKTMGQEQAHE